MTGYIMPRMLALLFSILSALASAAGYLVLNEMIPAGERLIAEGQYSIATEGPALAEGKADLASGRLLLAEGKEEYAQAHDNPFLVFADKWFNAGKGFAEGRKKLAEGEAKVAKGEDKVEAGEKRLDEGNLALRQGIARLRLSKQVRVACAVGAIVFTLLSIALGFLWRRPLLQFVRRVKGR